MPKKNLALNNMFPMTSADTPTSTQEALSKVFPEVEEEALKSVVQDIGRAYRNIPVDKIAPNPFQPRKQIDQPKRVVADKGIQIVSTGFAYSIPAQPSSDRRIVISVTVVQEIGFVVLILRGKPERVELGHWPGGTEKFSEGTINIKGGSRSIAGLCQAGDVAVRIEG